MAGQLTERAVRLLKDHIKANISTALADQRSNWADGKVTTEVPKKYFIHGSVKAYETPCCFIVPERIDFKKERGGNFITATIQTNVAVVIEDQDLEKLAIRAWRYQAALHDVIDQKKLTDVAGDFTMTVVVTGAEFSEEYTESTKPESAANTWRKGVILLCDIEIWEQLLIQGGS